MIRKTKSEKKQDGLIRAWLKTKPKKKKERKNDYAPAKLRRLPYAEFLQSDYWKHVRKAVMARDEYKCRVCGEGKGLQVHHENYKNHFRELTHLEDLITLCEPCHSKWHKEIQVDYEVSQS